MNDALKKFLHRKDIQKALNKNDFDYIYNHIPKTKAIDQPFYACDITDVFVKAGIDFLSDISKIYDYMFWGLDIKAFTIPNFITKIGESAFSGCRSLKSITIPDSVTIIGDYAFSQCDSLTSITIPNSVESIHDGAFKGCSSLKSVIIPNYLTIVDANTFDECESLESVTIPSSVTDIGMHAFNRCKSLKSIILPKVMRIAGFAFDECTSLESVTISNSITDIGLYAFYNCGTLKMINYLGTKAEWIKVDRGQCWNGKPANSKPFHFIIHCTDGDIYANGIINNRGIIVN